MWSFSGSKLFRRCQRQWFYKQRFASALAHDPKRREAYLLSKLQSLYALRGQIVDDVIGKCLVPSLNHKRTMTLSDCLERARSLFDSRLDFARRRAYQEPDFSMKDAGDSFGALRAIEFGTGISDSEIASAWHDIELALQNLFNMSDVKARLHDSSYLRNGDKPLHFESNGVKVRAFPDVVAIYDDKPPLVIDWKVHTFATQDYRVQLAIYSIAVAEWFRGISRNGQDYQAKDIELWEVQLLTNEVRSYLLTDDDIDDVEAYIAHSAFEIEQAIGSQENKNLVSEDFAVTAYAETCQTCNFRTICWKESI